MITPKRQKATSMRYGYFDDKAREYVIDRPDTPAPWVNYLGSPAYGAIISNNAGGYSFERSGANGRILRYVFNQFDQPGRYIYLRDDESGDFWSASWQPVAKDLNDYQVKCCHGMGYTRMEASYADISSKAVYYVPQGKAYEVWALTVTNDSDRDRSLTLTGYAEFTNHSNYEQDPRILSDHPAQKDHRLQPLDDQCTVLSGALLCAGSHRAKHGSRTGCFPKPSDLAIQKGSRGHAARLSESHQNAARCAQFGA